MRTNAQPDGLILPADITSDPEIAEMLRDAAWQQLIKGNDDVDEYVDWVTDEGEVTDEQAEAAFDFVREARVAQQAGWPDEPTNLDRAFAGLEAIGILARQDFTCCGTCASAEIGDERDDTRTWRGYVYFHTQDTDDLVTSQSTYLGYGAFLDAWLSEAEWTAKSDKEKDRYYAEVTGALMAEAQAVVEREGLAWTWNGDLKRRILLDNAEFYALLTP